MNENKRNRIRRLWNRNQIRDKTPQEVNDSLNLTRGVHPELPPSFSFRCPPPPLPHTSTPLSTRPKSVQMGTTRPPTYSGRTVRVGRGRRRRREGLTLGGNGRSATGTLDSGTIGTVQRDPVNRQRRGTGTVRLLFIHLT